MLAEYGCFVKIFGGWIVYNHRNEQRNDCAKNIARLCMEAKMAKTFLLVDGNNLAFRCFYGVAPLTNARGMPVHAIYGFLYSLRMLEAQLKPDVTIVCFDGGRCEKRLQLAPDYKGNRAPTPDDFKVQMPYMKQATTLSGMLCCEKEGIEADDWIGSWCRFSEETGDKAIIASADKDMMQCVSTNVSQRIPSHHGWVPLDERGVFDKTGVWPNQIEDFLALIGDTADNYAGIAGVGPKTAASWLQCYGSIEGIFKNLKTLKPERFRSILEQSRDLLRRNQALATLERGTELIQDQIPTLETLHPDTDALEQLLHQLGLKQLARKLRDRTQPTPQQSELF